MNNWNNNNWNDNGWDNNWNNNWNNNHGTHHTMGDMKQLCQQHIGQHVALQTADHQMFNGIIENVDDENVYLSVPEYDESDMMHMQQMMHQPHMMPEMHQQMMPYGGMQPGQHMPTHMMQQPAGSGCGCGTRNASLGAEEQRQFIGPYGGGYGFGGYPYGWYGRPPFFPRPRRFQRLILPLAALVALSALPGFGYW
ncbi:hypothetical protein [Bacillus sp. FJAT-44742]|uniref:hypothetical protein n=1 Tax=Bacillus sp. FJAT-44742 TaxID=2014005 RepID=UPI000C23C315|nr:hypothetical protein [Bacillus sp. FJAT-44742]